MSNIVATPPDLLLAYFKRFIIIALASVLILAGATEAKEAATPAAQQGVELLFPAGTGKHAKGVKLSKEQKKAASLLKKLKAIEKGGNVNAADKQGQTALMHAAAQNNRLAVCWLVAKGADATKKSQKGKTAAELAKDKSLQTFLEECCVDKRPLSAEEKKQLQADGYVESEVFRDSGNFLFNLTRKCDDSPEDLKLIGKLLRWGCSGKGCSLVEEPLLASLLSRHGLDLATKGESGGLKPEMARLLLALGIKVGKGDALSQAQIAMLLDDADTLRKIVKEQPDLVNDSHKAACLIACLGTPETLQVLIEAGLDPKLTRDDRSGGKTSFIEDVLLGRRCSAVGIRALTAAGTPLPVRNKDQANILTDYLRYHYPFDPDLADALIEAGVDVNGVDDTGLPPLIAAAQWRKAPVVRHLLSKGAQINARRMCPGEAFDGETALYAAVRQGRPEVVRLLLQKGADTKAIPEGRDRDSVLQLAVRWGEYDKVKALLDHGVPMEDVRLQVLPTETDDPLFDRIEKLLFYLLEHGAKAQSLTTEGDFTPPMYLLGMSKRIAKRLLDDGVDPNAQHVCRGGRGPKVCALGLTLQRGRADIAKYLQQRGAKMVGDLLLAKPQDMRAMLEAGASVPEDLFKKLDFSTIKSDRNSRTNGFPPKLTLEELTEAAKILRNAGAKPTMSCTYGYYDLGDAGVAVLLAAGVDPNEKNEKDEYFFLHTLVPRITSLFLKAGVNVNLQDKEGNTALMLVCQKGQGKDECQEVLSLLLNAGADPNIKNKEGKTALQYAREKKADDIVKLLKEHGAKE